LIDVFEGDWVNVEVLVLVNEKFVIGEETLPVTFGGG